MVRCLYSGPVVFADRGGRRRRARRPRASPRGDPGGRLAARTDQRYLLPFGPDGLNSGLTATTTADGLCGFPSTCGPGSPRCLGLHR